jgi:hypothetical protein
LSFSDWRRKRQEARALKQQQKQAQPKKERRLGYKMMAKILLAAHLGLMTEYPPARIYQLDVTDLASGKVFADFSNAAKRELTETVFPPYNQLPPEFQRVLTESAVGGGFSDGAAFYARLPDRYKAGVLNFFAKSQATDLPDGTTVLGHLHGMREVDQDRIFISADEGLAQQLDASVDAGIFNHRGKMDSSLHHARGSFNKYASYKTFDPEGNLDITLSSNGKQWMAEIDIDYYKGFRHFFFEVLYNHSLNQRTDPFHVERILRKDQGIDPGYRPK